MRGPILLVGLAAIVLLSSCSDGGGGDDGAAASTCAFVLGDTSCSPIVGGCNNTVAVGDGDLGTSGTFSAQSGGFLATGGVISFTDPGNPGVFLTPPSGMTLTDITIATYMDADNSVVQSATGPALTSTPTPGDPATHYISFDSTLPFNGVKLIVNTPDLGQFMVYEFCGAATVR